MSDIQETINSLTQELRRGTIVIGVLSQLFEPQYGYSLVSVLEEKGFSIDPSTLYPLLRRLEKQNLLESKWDTHETRPRKYYLLSTEGKEVYQQLCKEWESMKSGLEILLQGGRDDNGAN
jgi:PadR family transcriptional regulator, regulatory protein PadR